MAVNPAIVAYFRALSDAALARTRCPQDTAEIEAARDAELIRRGMEPGPRRVLRCAKA